MQSRAVEEMDQSMEYRQLGTSNLRVSSIGLGCVTFGREIGEAEALQIMDHAVARGINLFDTADAYGMGASETVLGRWFKDRGTRDQVILTTKAGLLASSDPGDAGFSRQRILKQIDLSLGRLQTDHVDLYLLHTWNSIVPLEETLEALDRLVQQGKVRYVGCSNYMAWQLCRALWLSELHGWARFQAVQNAYSLVKRDSERELLPLCTDQRVGMIAYSPLGAGFLTGKYHLGGQIPSGTRFDVMPGHQTVYFDDVRWKVMEGVRAIASELGVPMARLALAWALSQPAITTVLIGARDTGQVDNAFAAEAMPLSAETRAALNALWPVPLATDAGMA
jgi:aryl-alcohol dehydrogenase-like predicted oxidoreductase